MGKHFVIAITLTVLEFSVALRYGTAIWQAYSGVIWSRLLLLLLTAVWATSLAHLWSRAHREWRRAAHGRRIRLSPILVPPAHPTRGRDV